MVSGVALPRKTYLCLPALVSSSRISSRTCAAVSGASSDCSAKDASSLSIISAFSDRPATFAAASSFSLSSLVSLMG